MANTASSQVPFHTTKLSTHSIVKYKVNYTLEHISYRLKMYSFWNDESRLSADTLSRLTQLLAVLYSTSTERQFLYHSTNLLLELTSRSPDFSRSVFDDPLSECKFEVC